MVPVRKPVQIDENVCWMVVEIAALPSDPRATTEPFKMKFVWGVIFAFRFIILDYLCCKLQV
jgi:hypothetical protein